MARRRRGTYKTKDGRATFLKPKPISDRKYNKIVDEIIAEQKDPLAKVIGLFIFYYPPFKAAFLKTVDDAIVEAKT